MLLVFFIFLGTEFENRQNLSNKVTTYSVEGQSVVEYTKEVHEIQKKAYQEETQDRENMCNIEVLQTVMASGLPPAPKGWI